MAEAAGLVLAVLPLMISATEHFNSARRAISRFRRFSAETKRLLSVVNTQRTIFRGEVRLLLGPLAGRDIAQHMLDDLDHPNWTDTSFAKAVNTHLGDGTNAVAECASMIRAKLQYLEDETGKYSDVPDHQVRVSHQVLSVTLGIQSLGSLMIFYVKTSSTENCHKSVGRRLKLSLVEPELSKHVEELKDFIRDFRVLRAQAEELQQQPMTTKNSPSSVDDIERFTIMQKTSRMLYEALSVACTKHVEHYTRFSLGPIYKADASYVQFNLAFRPSVVPRKPIWLTVESTLPGTLGPIRDPAESIVSNSYRA
ncbi:MAG: hypothetical protein Q9227_004991 [Pyrenula ochraceoflavens]